MAYQTLHDDTQIGGTTAKAVRLPLRAHLSYSAFQLPLSFGFIGLMMFIPTYYAVDMGLGLAATGLIIALGRLIDFISDPVLGVLSDRTRSKFGRRKPWALIGLPLLCFAIWGLFQPALGIGPAYLFVFIVLYFIGFTACDLPHSALGLEMSSRSHERSWLAAGRTLVFLFGGLIAAASPALLGAEPREALSLLAKVALVTAVIVGALYFLFTPDKPAAKLPQREGWKALTSDVRLRSIIGIHILTQMSAAFSGGVSLLFAAYVLSEPTKLGLFWVATGLGLLLAMPIWVAIGRRLGKLRAWALSNFLGGLSYLPFLFLGEGQWKAMIGFSFISGTLCAANAFFTQSVLADYIGDSGQENSAGLIAGAKNASSKIAGLAPMLIAFPILGFLGLSASESGETIVTATALESGVTKTALLTFYVGVPFGLLWTSWAWLRRLTPDSMDA